MRHRRLPTPSPYPAALCLSLVLSACAPVPEVVAPKPGPGAATDCHHTLEVRLTPSSKRLQVRDKIAVPAASRELRFDLHAGLSPRCETKGVRLTRCPETASTGSDAVPLENFAVVLPEGCREFVLHYGGSIHHPLQGVSEEYARSFSSTPGTIGDTGVYLAAASHWIPAIQGQDSLRFTLRIDLPTGWDAVSQGKRTLHERTAERTRVQWVCDSPQEEVYLVAARFTEYGRKAAGIDVQAFLRTPDPALAEKYLATTGQYVEMYNRLIGPYPYEKFALVENFWETGYGMPSFTLLGPKIIRFPFILHSSYPHEILHNWWGNGVYVDYAKGNWCEGLTAYLADHLIKEQRGQGMQYRRTTLQRYADFVGESKDFPLTEFRSRHDSVTQAIGYGKMLMVCHMLRRQLGDRRFVSGLQELYAKNRFRRVSFAALEAAFGKVAGKDMRPFFDQWCRRAGAPSLQIATTAVVETATGYRLELALRQTQAAKPFVVNVPIVVTVEGVQDAQQMIVRLAGREHTFRIDLEGRPVRVDVDPGFDVFRRLDRAEVPPALTGAFGSDAATFVIPSAAPAALQDAYRTLARIWTGSQHKRAEVVLDADLAELPTGHTVWLLGWENRFRELVAKAAGSAGLRLTQSGVRIGETRLQEAAGHSAIVTTRHPGDAEQTLGWIGTSNAAAVPGLIRKLPHYGKYSYLGFAGDEPANIAKGIFPSVGSPLVRVLGGADAAGATVARGVLPRRSALAQLPPAFNAARMQRDIAELAKPEWQGRGFGSTGLEAAAGFIAAEFRKAGLQPGGTAAGSFFQEFASDRGEGGASTRLRNVVACIPGTDPKLAGQSVVLGAHYDHLGLGWPDVHAGDAGKMHPGADDNASGVAVMLELARVFGRSLRPKRSLVFIAFAGEEAGLLGSRHYVAHETRHPAKHATAMVNLDTVGRLDGKPLTVFGTGTATEWVHIFRGVGYVTGAKLRTIADDIGSSDQKSFTAIGIPAVQLFSGTHLDYHRPTDTLDKIDAAGLLTVAAVTQETITYLVDRVEPLTVAGTKRGGAEPAQQGSRRVSLGSVPDFGFAGPGVRITGTTPDSPAAQAGLQAGDVILALGGKATDDLRAMSDALKSFVVGQKIAVEYRRGAKRHEVVVELVGR